MSSDAAGMGDTATLPVIDITTLVVCRDGSSAAAREVAGQIHAACREHGFFYVVGHGVDINLQQRLESLSQRFFATALHDKKRIRMQLGGRAWRGYFAVGEELTSGLPDQKEGLYFGSELHANHDKVRAGVPLHGANLFPQLPGFRDMVLDYIAALTAVGHALMRGLSISLGLDSDYFDRHYTHDPLILFRIFNYPPLRDPGLWSVGEHTDYGVLTILRQDRHGGLQVKAANGSGWLDAPPLENAFVCNIGDMLDRITGGLYRSTAHRVRNLSDKPRLSFPFFFDPNFDAEVKPLQLSAAPHVDANIARDLRERWDRRSVHDLRGTYGEYLLAKVSRVFPNLHNDVL